MLPSSFSISPSPILFLRFPCGSADKESACNVGDLQQQVLSLSVGPGSCPIQPAKLQWRCFPVPACIPLGGQRGLECWCLRPQLRGPPGAPGPGTGACAPVLPRVPLSLQPWALQDSAAASGNLCWTLAVLSVGTSLLSRCPPGNPGHLSLPESSALTP